MMKNTRGKKTGAATAAPAMTAEGATATATPAKTKTRSRRSSPATKPGGDLSAARDGTVEIKYGNSTFTHKNVTPAMITDVNKTLLGGSLPATKPEGKALGGGRRTAGRNKRAATKPAGAGGKRKTAGKGNSAAAQPSPQAATT